MGEYRKTFVNRIYTVGLTTCGSALVRIAGATESEGFQKVASFVNKWICGGNNTGQTLAEIQALCNEILNEVKIVDQHLKEYDAEIENTLQKIQYTEAKNELNQQWSKDIDVYETAGNVGNTLSAYEDYMKAAQLYMDGKTDINAVEKSKQKLYDNFIEVYKAAGNSFENPTDEKKKDAIFCNDTIDGVFKRSIWSMINALNKPSDEKNYADAAAQFAYRAYGFSGDQYNYIVSSIDKQFMEIIKMEMMYQEFIAQRGDYFEEKYPDDESKWESYAACLYDDNSIESLKKITDACHEEGAKVSIQLQNAGPEGNAKNAGAPIQAATAIASADGRDIPEEVSTEKVYELVKGYGEAAERAMKGGADAVEIHMAHGYLVNSFMSPRTNKRVDEFGGNFENRMRFSRLIIEEVKKKTEGKIAVLARINSTEDMFGGLDNHDMCAVASYLEDCGIDGLHVSRAVHLKDEYMWAPTGIHGGFSAELVANIKKCVSIPVITVGRYTEPQFAEQIIKMGNADLVAFGRQSLADPHTPQKAMEERLEDLTPCIACLQGCVANMYAGKPICCLVNPVLGHEKEGLPKAEKAKKVYVIGGGVAGMCAAFTAKRRGHDVTLFEATDKLGGNMRLAAYPPGKGDITGMIRSYIVKCEKAGVNIKMNTKVTAQMLKEDTPDAVILATGAETLVLPFIKGIENPDIVYGVDCLEGTRPVGHKVLVVGGGMVGAETADFLAEQGHEVAIIEMRDAIGPDVIHEHRIFLMEAFEKYGIKQITSAAVSEIFSDGVSYKNAADKSDETIYEARGFDTVVLSMGFSSRYTHRDGQNVVYDFAEELKDIVPEVHMVGDAVRARRALDATKEAYEVALNL